ncbi:hypothetical protein MATL_G00158450 [Megalops atlanticus]|uniref:Tyrosine-protein kinase n=1 Tax=Megalops atlanticus TaxID=7932 RepID=A0A9D3PSE3_MEGAT|nr:hypothetical protein MATL_G00158450 [Megalops atlanticus]
MGNTACCEKTLNVLCPTKREDPKNAFTALYSYLPRTVKDLKLQRGDLLEVLEETEHWLYVRKRTLGTDRNNRNTEERGYVPRQFVKPTYSPEAKPWYFDSISKRMEAKRCLLRSENGDGAFLVWRSEVNQHYYLSIRHGEFARHYKILEAEESFYLVSRKKFQTLAELVKSYAKDADGLCVKLEKPCVKLELPSLPTLSYEDPWEVKRSSLQKVERLGSGEFGEVWQGLWNGTTEVAIKEFKVMNSDILNEIAIMKKLNHKRLLKLYAVCTNKEPFCIITELMKNGSLNRFLRNHKQAKDIEFSLLMDFAIQITEGMAYLETNGIVHRDLRADNILLTDMQSCKIADFGLAQNTFSGEQKSDMGEKIPVKWMAPEIFKGEKYTTKCDIWSFGILLSEIMTYGEEPYSGKDKASCITAILRGYRMPKPADCPQSVYDIMLLCWKSDPLERPTFPNLQEQLLALVQEPEVDDNDGAPAT